MKSTLHVKNFGPIKDAKLELSNVNVLIGPQASGKSTLAKLYTICKSPAMYHTFSNKPSEKNNAHFVEDATETYVSLSYEEFLRSVNFYSMKGYLDESSEIFFTSPTHQFLLKNGKIEFEDKLDGAGLQKAYHSGDKAKLKDYFNRYNEISAYFSFNCARKIYQPLLPKENITESEVAKYIDFIFDFKIDDFFDSNAEILFEVALEFQQSVFNNNAIYIPAERTIVNLIKRAALNLQRSKVPLPEHLLDYAAKFESAVHSEEKIDLDFIKTGLKYSFENGEDLIYFSEGNSIKLTDSASGIQSVVPMLLPLIQASSDKSAHFSFVIEEPETNLFPKAQYDVLKFIESGRSDDEERSDIGAIHTYTTHSPFILSGFNNMLYAFKKGDKAEKATKEKIASIIPKENWIDPENFSAYQIKDGKAESIVNRELGLIDETLIDQVSEEIIDDFRKIAIIASEK